MPTHKEYVQTVTQLAVVALVDWFHNVWDVMMDTYLMTPPADQDV